MTKSYIAIFALTVFLSGCASKRPSYWTVTDDFDTSTAREITEQIRLVADSQIHESRGTASRFFSLAGDEFVSVTIRTGQQVIGSGDLLRAALSDKVNYPLTLHLGDAIDVSCKTEWDHFARVIKGELGEPGAESWLFAPGNHDGFLVGNFFPLESGAYTDSNWNQVCNAGRASIGKRLVNVGIPKHLLVSSYVNDLLKPMKALPESGSECHKNGKLCVAYQYGTKPWSSYVVQLVKLPQAVGIVAPVYALMLDTSDYPTRPYIWPGMIWAGDTGKMSAAQTQAALALVKQLPSNAKFFIAAHHPYQSWKVDKWDRASRSGFDQLIGDPRFMRLLVSAHTHEGGWYEHKNSSGSLFELNLGSLSDAPVYFRSLAFEEDSAGVIKVNSKRILLSMNREIDCRNVPKPSIGYRTADQASYTERHAGLPIALRYIAGFGHATVHFLKFWEAKHKELEPQLLAYADVVTASMPLEHRLVVEGRNPFMNRDDLVHRLKNCDLKKDKCSVQEKGHILMALDDYYWMSAPQEVKNAGHQMRYCMALNSALDAGANSKVVEDALERTTVISMTIPAKK